jgi:DNA-binding NarL/FixJ family response regulator
VAGELTETQQQVATLAATGLTNKQIAAQMFMSPKTVEANLSKVYEKVGVHSRTQLAAQITRTGSPPPTSALQAEQR